MNPATPTSHFYSQNAIRLAEKYDKAADGILPIVEKFARSKDIHILDYGCGTGRDLSRLYAKGYTNVMGYDPKIECPKNYLQYFSTIELLTSAENF